jgi:hypothetical protein
MQGRTAWDLVSRTQGVGLKLTAEGVSLGQES